jgi:hypothetical protein
LKKLKIDKSMKNANTIDETAEGENLNKYLNV